MATMVRLVHFLKAKNSALSTDRDMEHAPGHSVTAPGRLSSLQEENLTDVPLIDVSQPADRMAPPVPR